jgi:ABC-2 type transport system ATP-binding protein
MPPTTSPTNRSFTAGDSAKLTAVETSAAPSTPEFAASPVLEARGLVKRFGARVALKGVSLAAGRGELVAVIGPNGAGKTTLLSILAGIQGQDEGVVSKTPRELGWVPQQPALYGKLTVEENLALFARLEGVPDTRATVERMLDLTDLRERAHDQVGTLSGGNRQRVNIAIGLLAEPEVLLLDEPTAALDPRQRERLWQFILRLAGEGTTVVYATHNVQEADRYATRLIVLADGERLFHGSPRELEAVVGASGLDFEAAFVEFLHQRGH